MILAPLFHKAWRDHRRGFIGWLVGVIGITIIQLSVYPSIRDSRASWGEAIKQFPEALQKMFRMADYTSEIGYLSTELFAITLPLLFIGVGASWGARATAEDEETGTADILLSLPISRRSVIATRMVAMFSALVALAAVLFATLMVGAQFLDLSISVSRYIDAGIVLVLVGMVFGAIAMLFGTITGHKGAALGYSVGLAIALFVLYSLAPLVSAFETILKFNPLQWTIGSQPLALGIDTPYMLLALGLTATLIAGATIMFDRRDIVA